MFFLDRINKMLYLFNIIRNKIFQNLLKFSNFKIKPERIYKIKEISFIIIQIKLIFNDKLK